MKIRDIYESQGRPNFGRAISVLIAELATHGYKLVRHIWEDGDGSRFDGFFIARYPNELATYKLRNLEEPDAYHLGRSFIEDQVEDKINDLGNSKLSTWLRSKYPEFDKTFKSDGIIHVPNEPQFEDLFDELGIPFEIDDDGMIAADLDWYISYQNENSDIHNAKIIDPEEMLTELDEQDLPVIAKRLYDITEGDAQRWVEYRLDVKTHKPLVDWDKINEPEEPEDPADWWKQF